MQEYIWWTAKLNFYLQWEQMKQAGWCRPPSAVTLKICFWLLCWVDHCGESIWTNGKNYVEEGPQLLQCDIFIIVAALNPACLYKIGCEHQLDMQYLYQSIVFSKSTCLDRIGCEHVEQQGKVEGLGVFDKSRVVKSLEKLLLLESGFLTPNLICQKSTCPSDSGKLLTTLDRAKGKRECLAQNDSPLMVAPSRGPGAKRILIYLFIHLSSIALLVKRVNG